MRKGGDKPLESKLARSVALSVARGMAYLHNRSPPILHLVSKHFTRSSYILAVVDGFRASEECVCQRSVFVSSLAISMLRPEAFL